MDSIMISALLGLVLLASRMQVEAQPALGCCLWDTTPKATCETTPKAACLPVPGAKDTRFVINSVCDPGNSRSDPAKCVALKDRCCIKFIGGGQTRCNEINANAGLPIGGLDAQCSFITTDNEAAVGVGVTLGFGSGPCNRATETCPGVTVTDDPHFVGFQPGQRFDYHGEAGKVYSLISEKRTQLNAQMIGLKDKVPGEDGTYLGPMGVMYMDKAGNMDKISVVPVHGSQIAVKVNDKVVKFIGNGTRSAITTLPTGAEVQLLKTTGNDEVTMARIRLGTMSLAMMGTGHHLDLIVDSVKAGLCRVHGVLGQTYKPKGFQNPQFNPQVNEKIGTDTTFLPEVHSDLKKDYEVSHLFGADNHFNVYGNEDVKCYDAPVARRKLQTAASASIRTCAGWVSFNTGLDTVCALLRKRMLL